MDALTYRPLLADDEALLAKATLGNLNWVADRYTMDDVVATPEFAHYVRFVPERGDFGVMVESGSQPIGVVWALFLPPSDPGFGYVAGDIPEVSLWVHPNWRGRGLGRQLLQRLQRIARKRGVTGLSLSVEEGNFARGLYASEGFVDVVGAALEGTMVWKLLPHPLTGDLFSSPVAAGRGWPEDRACAETPRSHEADDVAELARGATDLVELDARVSVCRACPRLVAWREHVAVTKRAAFAEQPYWGRPAPGWGDPEARVLVVGLAPAAHGANRTGRIFTGDRSGDWLYAALHRAGFANQPTSDHAGDGLRVQGLRITAPVHCAPPENKPLTSEKLTCAPWLERELELLEPYLEAIVTLGGIAWTETLRAARRMGWTVPRPAPKFGHGDEAVLTMATGRDVRLIGCYHVSQQNTFTGKLTAQMLDDVFGRLR